MILLSNVNVFGQYCVFSKQKRGFLQVFLITLSFVLISQFTSAQGASCAEAEGFCTGSTYTFPAGVNTGDAESGNNYGCLGSQPNPAWYYLEIDQGGNLDIEMSNSANVDIDFILYGPFNDLNDAMGNCGNMGSAGSGAGWNGIVDCSYSDSENEEANISNAQPGDVYVLLITNYSNQSTNIVFSNSPSSTATTDCSVVEPCEITNLSVTVGTCDPSTGEFDLSGTFDVADPPETGSLLAEDCNGNQVVIANAPFSPGNHNFTIPDITADGQSCSVRVYFSDDGDCELSVNYTNAAPCDPLCSIVDFTSNINLPNCATNWLVDGQIEFDNPPALGDLIIEDCDGNQEIIDSYPFQSGQIPYSFTGPPAAVTDRSCSFRLFFSGEPNCEFTVPVTLLGGLIEYANISYNDPVYCQSGSVNPVPSLTGTPGGTYSSGAGLIINTTTGEIDLTMSQPGVYTVTYQTPDPNCFATATTQVTIGTIPTVNAGADITICNGESVVLTGSGADTYTWDNAVSDGVPFYPANSGTYTVTGTTTEGCSATDDMDITIVQMPTPGFVANVMYGCIPLEVSFIDTTQGSYQTCFWDFGNGSSSSVCGNATTTYDTPGCFDVSLTLTTPEGCSGTTRTSSYICVESDPVADFSSFPTEITTSDPVITLTNQSSGATSYEWYFGDGSPLSGEFSPSHTYSGYPESYTITLTAYTDAGCVDSVSQLIVVGTDLIFYVPNSFTPDQDEHNPIFQPVFTSGFDPYNYKMLIFNRWGEILFESNNAEVGWDGTYGGNIVQDGTYLWKITYKIDGVDKHQEVMGHVILIR